MLLYNFFRPAKHIPLRPSTDFMMQIPVPVSTVALLFCSNLFMTFAWYGHLKFKEMKFTENLGLITIILISWGIALFEYFLMVPANRIGYKGNGGPFNLFQLKVIQEVITLSVFVIFTVVFFKTETFRSNDLIAFILMIMAVYFVFKK